MAAPAVSITVVAYNSDATLPSCLRSVRPPVDSGLAEAIVVDNASPDRSAECVAAELPAALLLRADRNLGFAGGHNLAWTHARGRYWLLLNPDVIVPPGGIEALVAWADAHPDVGAVSPELVDDDGNVACAARRFHTIGRSLLELSRLHLLLPAALRERILLGAYSRGPGDRLDVDWVPATAVLVRRQAVEAAGVLAEDLPFYAEDSEWCARIGRAGFRIAVCGSPPFVHRESESARRTFGDDERDLRLWYGVYASVERLRGRFYRRALQRVNVAAMALESLHPLRSGVHRDQARRHLAAQKRLLAGWRPGALPGAGTDAAGTAGPPWS